MKKLFSVLAVLFVLGTTNVFAKTGVGAQFGANVAGFTNGQAGLTFKLETLPCVFALDLGGGQTWFNFGLTADWWMANPKIEGTWGYYYGAGVAVGAYIFDNYANVSFGPRALIGTNIFLLERFLEFYLQLAWQPTFTVGSNGLSPNWGYLPVDFGFRFWF